MPKDTYYFSHDYNARNDEKILELRSEFGAEGYGIFWMIVETMAENDNGCIRASLMGGLSHGYGIPKDRLTRLIEYCMSIGLFYKDGDNLFSKRLLKHKEFRQKLSKQGRKGAETKWNKENNDDGGAMAGLSDGYSEANGGVIGELKGGFGEGIAPPMQRKGKERKIKENFIKEISNFPKSENYNGLPEIQITSLKTRIKTTQYIDITDTQVNNLWEVFKIQNLTGDKFYQNEKEVYKHFSNWAKDQKFDKIVDSNTPKPKLIFK